MTKDLLYVRFRTMRNFKTKKGRGLSFSVEVADEVKDLLQRHKPVVEQEVTAANENAPVIKPPSDFAVIFNAFWENVGGLIRATPEAQTSMGIGTHAAFEGRLRRFLEERGTQVGKTRSSYGTYAMKSRDYRLLSNLIESHQAQAALVNSIPQLLVPTIIAHYDAFISRLMLLIFKLKPELTKSIQKDISFSALVQFSSIEEAARSIIDREVEAVMRGSHLDQLTWMSKKFGVPLKPEDRLNRGFCELTERRNIIIHNDAIANEKYFENCESEGVDLSTTKLGDKLSPDGTYLRNALAYTLEMATKIHQVLWRRFAPDQQEEADQKINDITYELILNKRYAAAAPLFEFCRSDIKKWSSEEKRLMNVVNHANLLQLQRKSKASRELLDKEDWTTKTPIFQLCVAAVKRENVEAIEVFKKYGKALNVTAADYVHWPVFWELVKDDEFLKAYKEIYQEELFHKPSKTETTQVSQSLSEIDEGAAA